MTKIFFTFGGLPHYYNYVLNRLNELENTSISVIIPKGDGSSLGKGVYQDKSEIQFKVFPLEETVSWYGKVHFPGMIELLREENPDILVTIWPYSLEFALNPKLRKAIKELGIKLIYKDIPFNIPKYEDAIDFYLNEVRNEHGHKIRRRGPFWYLYYQILKRLVKKYLDLMDAHVYYCEEAFDIIPSYGVPDDKIFITYNSPDTDRLMTYKEEVKKQLKSSDHKSRRLLHVGRLVKWKKVDLLMDAFFVLKKKYEDLELWIVGDGPEIESLKGKAQNSSDDEIKFLGAIYDPVELGKIFSSAGIYVLAGMGGLSLNEAMLYEKPILCSVADGTEKKLVRNDYNGYIFKESDLDDLVSKLDQLLADPKKIDLFGKRSLEIILNEVNIQKVIEGYQQAFNYVSSK